MSENHKEDDMSSEPGASSEEAAMRTYAAGQGDVAGQGGHGGDSGEPPRGLAEQLTGPFSTAFEQYLSRLDRTWNATKEACDLAQQAFERECATASAAQLGGQGDAFRTYVLALREAWQQSQVEYKKAYDGHLETTREAWQEVGEKLSPVQLFALGQVESQVASLAQLTMGSWTPFLSGGVQVQLVPYIRTA